MATKNDLRHTVNELMGDLTNIELCISALQRQGLTADARNLRLAESIVRQSLQRAREELEAAK